METNLDQTPAETVTPPPVKGGKKTILVISALVVLLLVAGSAYAYTALDFFKSDKQVYLEAETKGMVDLTKGLQKAYDGYQNKYIKPYLENTVNSKIEISADLSGIVPPDPTAAILLDVLKNSKIIADTAQDMKNQQLYSKVDLAVGGNNLIGMEYFTDKNKLALRIPAIYKKYGYADLKDRDKLQTRFGIPRLPKRLVTYSDYADAFKISQQDVDYLLQEYGKLYADSLIDSQFTSQKTTFVEGETKIKAREITLTLSESQYKELLKKFAGKMQTDEKLLDLIYNKQKTWIKLMDDSGNSLAAQGIKEKSKDEIKASLKQFNQDLDKNLQQLKMPAGVKMTLLVDADDNILDRKISFTESTSKVLIRTASWLSQDKGKNYLVNIRSEEPTKVDVFDFQYTTKPENALTTKGTLAVTTKEIIEGKEKQLMQFDTGYTVTKDGNKQQVDIMFSGQVEQETPQKFTGSMKTTIVDNDKDKSKQTDSVIELKFAQAPEESKNGPSLKVTIKGKDEFGTKLVMPKLDVNNSVDLANVSDVELMQIQQEIQAGIQGFMIKNQALIMPFAQ